MTADVELLPLPDKTRWGDERDGYYYGHTDDALQAYALACVAHATAARDTEVEALRAECASAEENEAIEYKLRGEAEARAERLAEALRESHGEVLRLRDAMFRVYATAANGGNPTMAIEQMRDEMDKPWSGDKARAALEQEAGRG